MFLITTAFILQHLLVNVKCMYILSIFHSFNRPYYTLKRDANVAFYYIS